MDGKKIKREGEEELKICAINRLKYPRNGEEESIAERVGRIAIEFTEGLKILEKYDLAATFFGSSRSLPDSEEYQLATELSGRLSRSGFAIITGGAAGIMEAANKGAYDAGGHSVGMNISLPQEQSANHYTTEAKDFHYFFSRKVMLTFASEIYIYFPGGFGTLDEFFEIVTLVQTRKIEPIPIILFGKEYWTPLVTLLKEELLEKHQTISPGDMNLFTIVDSVDEAYEAIMDKVCV
ncbi:MAG: TIGR00730 family Rossman fold protein [Candidatus Pacebacteria bacterium]|nr:TIGR00730 family Rossman fold protein [Candidatus Paceibacterota bacterium]